MLKILCEIPATPIEIEGTFQGANCIFYNKTCPANMTNGHIATEPDFVFVSGNGKYVFVPNLGRGLKIKYLHTKLKLIGKQTGDSVRAEVLKINEKGKFKKVWSLEEQEEERRKKKNEPELTYLNVKAVFSLSTDCCFSSNNFLFQYHYNYATIRCNNSV